MKPPAPPIVGEVLTTVTVHLTNTQERETEVVFPIIPPETPGDVIVPE